MARTLAGISIAVKFQVFSDVISCRLANSEQRFEGYDRTAFITPVRNVFFLVHCP